MLSFRSSKLCQLFIRGRVLGDSIQCDGHTFYSCGYKDPRATMWFLLCRAERDVFGKAEKAPQNERTHFHSRSSYGIGKVAGFRLTNNYREAYKIFTSSGISFNHESPQRGFEFVTRKITSAVARILAENATEWLQQSRVCSRSSVLPNSE